MSAHDSSADGLLPAERRASAASAETHSSGGHTERGSASTTVAGASAAHDEGVPQSGLRQRLADVARPSVEVGEDHASSPFGEARKKLRIGFIHPDLGIGGAERLVVDAALGLQARGHDVSIFTSHHDPKHCFEPTRDGTLKVYHMRTRIPRSLPPFHAFHLPLAIMQQVSLVVQLIIALALTSFPWLASLPFIAGATSIRSSKGPANSSNPDAPAGTPCLPLPPFDLFIFDQLSVGIPLLRLGTGTRVAYYCHFPDKEIAKALDRQARAGARGIKQKAVAAVKIALKTVYRVPFDLLEEVTTDCADRLMVNSYYTAAYFLHSFPIIASRLSREAKALGKARPTPGVGNAPKVVYPAVDTSEFSVAWVATELKRLEDADKKAKERATAAMSAPPGSLAFKEKAKLTKEGSRGVLDVRKAIRDLCTSKDRPTFVSINRFEAKKNIALAVSAFADLIQPELEATKEAQTAIRRNPSFTGVTGGSMRASMPDLASPTSQTPSGSPPRAGEERSGGRSADNTLRIDTSGRELQPSASGSSSRSSSTASFARFAQLNQMTRANKSLRGPGGLRLVVAGGYDRRVLDNISTLQALRDQCDRLGLRHITLSYNPQPFEPPVSPPVADDLNGAHVIFLQSAPVGCLRALLTSESTVGLVYTPAGEHFGIVPLEAAACGLPVLAVNDGGPRESIVDGQVVKIKRSVSTGSFPSSSSTSTVRNHRPTESRPGTAKGSDQQTPRGSMTGSRPVFKIGDEPDTLDNIKPVAVPDNDDEEPSATSGSVHPTLGPRGSMLFDDRQRRKLLIACLKRTDGEALEEWTNVDGTGLLRSNNTEAFAAGMRSLLALWLGEDESQARKRVANAAQRRVSEHFGLEVLSQRLEEVALQCVRIGPISPLQILAPFLASIAMLITGAVVFFLLDQKQTSYARQVTSKVTAAVSATTPPALSQASSSAARVVTAAADAASSATSAVGAAAAAATSAVAEAVEHIVHVDL